MRQGQSRRRGRGGPRPPQQGGGVGRGPDMGNRQEHRNRGNAAQLLEKYKTLARDAQLQGDRITAEYYMQYADHYFRVLNENRPRFEEGRDQQHQQQRRRDWQERDEDERDYQRDDRRPAPAAINGTEVEAESDSDGPDDIASVLPPAFNRASAPEDGSDERAGGRRARRNRSQPAEAPVEAHERAEPPAPVAAADSADEEAPTPRRRRGRPRTRPEGDAEAEAELNYGDA